MSRLAPAGTRILHVFDHSIPLHSGYTFRSEALLRGQRQLGWDTHHITSPRHQQHPPHSGSFAAEGRAIPVETVDGLTFARTMEPPGWTAGWPVLQQVDLMSRLERRLMQWALEVQPDILHAHSPVLNVIPAIRVARALGIPVVYEVRAFWEDAAVDHGTTREGSLRYRMTRALETWALKRVDHAFTICEGLRLDLLARGLRPEHLTVIPNAVDLAAFEPSVAPDDALRSSLGLQGASVIGFIGSFYAYEGLDLLLQALPGILLQRPCVKVLLVGGGPQEAALKSQAQSLGLASQVIFAGRVPHEQVSRYYDLIDVLVYPRHRMRLTDLVTPLKPLEAMAQRRLMIASDVGGHRELIRHGVNGMLFEAGVSDSLSRTVLELLAQPSRWEVMKTAARQFVERERQWASSVGRYAPVYGHLLEGLAQSSALKSLKPRKVP